MKRAVVIFLGGSFLVFSGTLLSYSIEITIIRLILISLTVCLILFRMIPKEEKAIPDQTWTALVCFLALFSLSVTIGKATLNFFFTDWFRVGNVYHYYLGSKYFEELGYQNLYVASLQADEEGKNYWKNIGRVRNMNTYEVESRSAAINQYDSAEHFTPERWNDFQTDIEALQRKLFPDAWESIFIDRGYNPSPLWTAVGSTFAHLFSVKRMISLKALCSLDLVLFLLAFWLISSTYDLRVAAWILLFLTLSPVNTGRLVGGFLQYDWFCSFAVGLAFLSKGRRHVASVFFSYSVMTRVFPLILVGSALLPLVFSWIRTGKAQIRKWAFFLSLGFVCATFFSIGCMGTNGVKTWKEFANNTLHHSQHHVFGNRRVGLKHVFTHDLRNFNFDEKVEDRRFFFARQKGLYYAAAAAFLLFFILVVCRRSFYEAVMLGLVPFYVLVVSSRYYWSYLALLPLLTGIGKGSPHRHTIINLSQLLLYWSFYAFLIMRQESYPSYVVFNLLLAVLLIVLLRLYFIRGEEPVPSGKS